jgi:hypothetical protein
MNLRWIAQASALVSLGCLAMHVWLGGTRGVFIFEPGLMITALLHEMAILLLSTIGGTLAIVATTLLLTVLSGPSALLYLSTLAFSAAARTASTSLSFREQPRL